MLPNNAAVVRIQAEDSLISWNRLATRCRGFPSSFVRGLASGFIRGIDQLLLAIHHVHAIADDGRAAIPVTDRHPPANPRTLLGKLVDQSRLAPHAVAI